MVLYNYEGGTHIEKTRFSKRDQRSEQKKNGNNSSNAISGSGY